MTKSDKAIAQSLKKTFPKPSKLQAFRIWFASEQADFLLPVLFIIAGVVMLLVMDGVK